MQNSTARRIWTKPEIVGRTEAKGAQIGSNSSLVDQGFPASNGSSSTFS